MKKLMTLGLLVKNDKVLLGMKKRGFGQGFWNGFGGKLQEGEEIESALIREFEEEVGITPIEFEKRGIISFLNEKEKVETNKEVEVHIYKITKYSGKPAESEEMKPDWFPVDCLPFDSMWPDDPHWFPLFLKDKKFGGRFVFDESNNIIDQFLEEVSELAS